MVEASNAIKSLRYETVIRERFDNEYIVKTNVFKINIKPFKIFFNENILGMKIEGLYCEGSNNNQILICTKGFPWVQISVDPRSEKARKNHHHTIFEAGFESYVKILHSIKEKHRLNFSQIISYQGLVEINNKMCHKIVMNIPDYKIQPYLVKNGENITSIANKFFINDYYIVEFNKLKNYNSIQAGNIIKIPNYYGKRFVFYLYNNNHLPALIEIYDDKGLYASYNYSNLEINPHFSNLEFSTTNPLYHFK